MLCKEFPGTDGNGLYLRIPYDRHRSFGSSPFSIHCHTTTISQCSRRMQKQTGSLCFHADTIWCPRWCPYLWIHSSTFTYVQLFLTGLDRFPYSETETDSPRMNSSLFAYRRLQFSCADPRLIACRFRLAFGWHTHIAIVLDHERILPNYISDRPLMDTLHVFIGKVLDAFGQFFLYRWIQFEEFFQRELAQLIHALFSTIQWSFSSGWMHR